MPINTPKPNKIPNTHKIAIAHLRCTLLNSATLDHDLAFHAHSLPFTPNAIQQPNEIKIPMQERKTLSSGIKYTTISTEGQYMPLKRPHNQ